MENFISKNGKQLITYEKEIKCPYCEKGGFIQLHPKHLKLHNKNVNDVRKEYPEYPTMTIERYNKQMSISEIGGYKTKELIQDSKTKIVECYYKLDDDCSHETKEVEIYAPNGFLCNKCRSLKKESKDGRESDIANIKREKTFMGKYKVRNANQIIK